MGEWVGQHDCAKIVAMLHEADLDRSIPEQVVGNGLVPAITENEELDLANPCEGSVVREHSHFFTADGTFGSRDFNGEQVDGGTYELVGDDTIIINGATFHYSIDDDILMLEPEPIDIAQCATRKCRFHAWWTLMVALPGTPWVSGTISD